MVAAAIAAGAVLIGGAIAQNNQANQGASGAMGAINRGATNAENAIANTTNRGLSTVNSQTGKAVGAVQAGAANAAKQYAPYQAGGSAAMTQLEKLLGLGKGGQAGALKTLEATPGFQFAQQQGNQSTINAATATGMNLSGNTLEGLAKFNQGLATQTLNNQVGNLEGVANMGLSAAGGAAGAIQTGANTVGGIQQQSGITQANLLSNQGSDFAAIAQNQGTDIANVDMAQANAKSGIIGNFTSGLETLIGGM